MIVLRFHERELDRWLEQLGLPCRSVSVAIRDGVLDVRAERVAPPGVPVPRFNASAVLRPRIAARGRALVLEVEDLKLGILPRSLLVPALRAIVSAKWRKTGFEAVGWDGREIRIDLPALLARIGRGLDGYRLRALAAGEEAGVLELQLEES